MQHSANTLQTRGSAQLLYPVSFLFTKNWIFFLSLYRFGNIDSDLFSNFSGHVLFVREPIVTSEILMEIQPEYNKPSRGLQGSEIAFFSDSAGDVTLTKDNLYTYSIPPANSSLCPFGLNTNLGYKGYQPKVYKPRESTLGNFEKALLELGSKANEYKVIAPSSFFQYVSTLKTSEFNIIYINRKIIIANTETRAGQNPKMSYSGIRFEDLLCHGTRKKTLNNYNLYQTIRTVSVNGIKCIYCAEVDAVNSSGEYTEIKMILCRNSIPHAKTTNKRNILKMLHSGNKYFDSFLLRLITQCQFSGINNVLIGVRDASFNIRNITEFSVSDDLLPFFKHTYPAHYQLFESSSTNISNVMKRIKQLVDQNRPVWKLHIRSGVYTLEEAKQKQDIVDTVLIPEFKRMLV